MIGFKRFGWFFETHGPVVCGVLSFVILWIYQSKLLPLMVEDKISIGNLFSAVFGWASIQTGCVFAIYGFVAGKTDGFIGEVRHTRSMKRYSVYIKRAIVSGFILTVFSMPLIVWKFKLEIIDTALYLTFTLWFSIFVWAFLSFARVAYIFGLLIRFNDHKNIPGG